MSSERGESTSAAIAPPSPGGLGEQAAALRSELLSACARVLDSAWYVLGEEVSSFEREFAAWAGAGHCVGVASGSDALTLGLRALDVGPGDEVIVPANALPTAFGVAATGARLRFADVRGLDLNLDPDHVGQLVNERTRAIVAVHLYGHPADVEALAASVDRERVAIVEDCAQAHGATWQGQPVGAAGDLAAWSFYPTKNLGAMGDAGAVTTGDEALAARVRSLRVYGEQRRYLSTEVGVNSRLDELQAALLRVKLPHLDGWIVERRRVAAVYDAALADVDGVVLPPVREGAGHARHLYPVQVADRDRVLGELQAQGIPAGVHYPVGAHDQPAFADVRDSDLPVTERLCATVLSLPMHPAVSEAQARFVADALRRAIG
jgi:dTDP-4-amino-4,6-dideoxygalactose transaminase